MTSTEFKITIADSDKLAISDAGTEKFVLASNIKSYIAGSTLNITGSLSNTIR